MSSPTPLQTQITPHMPPANDGSAMHSTEPRLLRNPALWSLASGTLLAAFAGSSGNLALPQLQSDWQLSFGHAQWLLLAYLLASTVAVTLAGRLGDLFGRRRLLLGGLLLFGSAAAMSAIAPSLPWLLAARALQGVGAAALLALGLASVGSVVAPSHGGRALGMLGAVSAAGTALGPALGGVLLHLASWRWLLALPALAALLLWPALWHWLPADARQTAAATSNPAPGSLPDLRSVLYLSLLLSALAWTLTLSRSLPALLPLALLVIWLAARGLQQRQRLASVPLLPGALLQQAALRPALAANLLIGMVVMGNLLLAPFYLGRSLGLTNGVMGLLLACGPLMSMLCGVLGGRLVDQHGAARVSRHALQLLLSGSALLGFAPLWQGVTASMPAPAASLALYLAGMLMLTAGYALFQAANNHAVLQHAGAAQRGVAGGLLQLSRNLGLLCGASVPGALFDLAAQRLTLPAQAAAAGFSTAFLFCSALLAALWLWRRQQAKTSRIRHD